MPILFSSSRFLPLATLLLFAALPNRAVPQEIPLERCDALPVVQVTVGGRPMRFLVDTAATSMLNLKSFAEGPARAMRVTSWSGTLATSAREVTLDELIVGYTKLVGLKLPAIDLSAIGNACGRKIDGILGVDLLAKLGASIDLKKRTVHVATQNDARSDELAAAMHRDMGRCLDAFNNSDERIFADCLDPKIVLFTITQELYGREQTIAYFRDRYFHQKPPARLEIRESAFHAIGEAVWYEYEFTIESAGNTLRARGMAMCRKSDGRWRLASMHHSIAHSDLASTSK